MAQGGVSSKSLMRDGNDPSSVHQVVLNDDLVIEILLRLPIVSLFFFKSVSKRWLSLITSPCFFRLRLTRFPYMDPPSGLFLRTGNSANDHFEHDVMSWDSRIPPGKKSIFGCFGTDVSKVEVLQSCNGLVLCVIWTDPVKICVCNPSINMFKILPPVHDLELSRFLDSPRLAFDPTKSPHYKVLHTRLIDPPPRRLVYPRGHRGRLQGSTQTWIYSSETGCWRIGDTFPLEWFWGKLDRGVYWNDAIHWLVAKNRVRHFKLDVMHPPDTTTQLPNRNTYKELFESRGCLLLACACDPHPEHLEIYEMRNGYSAWSVRYIVKYADSSIEAFFKTWKMSTAGWFGFDVQFIVVGEREEESFAVMKLCGKLVKYNLLSKTLCHIDTHFTKFHSFPFFASFAGV